MLLSICLCTNRTKGNGVDDSALANLLSVKLSACRWPLIGVNVKEKT